ncbi:hypothetical protein BJ875DRAFT_444621 [Amylocarpus encephaloides]|uniref:Uncharacterized protein n=1 Tax=Amylocarpus encephaloides TaxID=45428 RepID=A0A9P7YBV7_9HELO|nr:hypothetical protein BJ875DRAFT_444621 [Amylocarpus encephaloides]
MSTLTNVIGQLQPWPQFLRHRRSMEQVANVLSQNLLRLDVDSFHNQHLEWIECQAQPAELRALCDEVAMAMKHVLTRAQDLYQWVRSSQEEAVSMDVGGFLARVTIERVIVGFQKFQVVADNDRFLPEPNKTVVLTYLKAVLTLSVTLGGIFDSPWYEFCKEQMEELDSFVFDILEDYIIPPQNRAREAVIVHQSRVPESYLGNFPTRPVHVHNDSGYGPAIVRNELD